MEVDASDSHASEEERSTRSRWLPRHTLFHPKHKPRNTLTFAPRPPRRPNRIELEATLHAIHRSEKDEEKRRAAGDPTVSPRRRESPALRELRSYAQHPPATAPTGAKRTRQMRGRERGGLNSASGSRNGNGAAAVPLDSEEASPSARPVASPRSLRVAEMLDRPEDLPAVATLIRSVPNLREVDLGQNPRWTREMPFAVPCVFGAIAQNVDLEEVHGTIPKEHERQVNGWLSLFQSLREKAAERHRGAEREAKIAGIIEDLKKDEVQGKKRLYDHWRSVIQLMRQERRAAYKLVNAENDEFEKICEEAETELEDATVRQRNREKHWSKIYSELLAEMNAVRGAEDAAEQEQFQKMREDERAVRYNQLRREREVRKFLHSQRQELGNEEHDARKAILQQHRDERRRAEAQFCQVRNRMQAEIDALEGERKRRVRAEMEALHAREVLAARHARQLEGISQREKDHRRVIEQELLRAYESLVRANFESFSSAKLRSTQRVAAEKRQGEFMAADNKPPRIIFKWEPPVVPQYTMNMYATPMVLNDSPLFRIQLDGVEHELSEEQRALKCTVMGGTIAVKVTGPSVARDNGGGEFITLATNLAPESWEDSPWLCGEAAPKPFSFRQTLRSSQPIRHEEEGSQWEEGRLNIADDGVTVLWNENAVATLQLPGGDSINFGNISFLGETRTFGRTGSFPGESEYLQHGASRTIFNLQLHPNIPHEALHAILGHLAYGNSAITGYDAEHDVEQGYLLSCMMSLRFRASCLPDNEDTETESVTRTSSCSVRLLPPLLAGPSLPETDHLEDSEPAPLFPDFIMHFSNGSSWGDHSEAGCTAATASGASIQGSQLCVTIGNRDTGDRILLRKGSLLSVGEERSLSTGQVAREILFRDRLVGLLTGDLFNTGDNLLPEVPCGPSSFLRAMPTMAFPDLGFDDISPTVFKINILRDQRCSLFMFQELVLSLMYTCVSQDPKAGVRVVDLKCTLRDGTEGSIRRVLQLVPVDDITSVELTPGSKQRVYRAHVDHPPSLERYVPLGAPFLVAPDALAEDPDSAEFTGGYLEVEIVGGLKPGDCLYVAEDQHHGLVVNNPTPGLSPVRTKRDQSLEFSTQSPVRSSPPDVTPTISFNGEVVAIITQGPGLRHPPAQQKITAAGGTVASPSKADNEANPNTASEPTALTRGAVISEFIPTSAPLIRVEFREFPIEFLQHLLRRIAFKATGTNSLFPMRYGPRKIEFRMIVGDPNIVKYRKFDPFVPVVQQATVLVTDPLVNTSTHSYVYREGSGMLHLGHLTVVDERTLGYRPFNTGFLSVECIRGGTDEDRLYFRSLDAVVSENGFTMMETSTPLGLPPGARMPHTLMQWELAHSHQDSPRGFLSAPRGGQRASSPHATVGVPGQQASVTKTRQSYASQPMLTGGCRHFDFFTAERSFLGSVLGSTKELLCVFREADKKPEFKRTNPKHMQTLPPPPPYVPSIYATRGKSMAWAPAKPQDVAPSITAIKRRDVGNLLRLLTYELRSSNPTKLRKIYLLTISDGVPSSVTHIVLEIVIQTVDDATEIHRTTTAPTQYRHGHAGSCIPVCTDLRLVDPDSNCFNGGYVTISLAGGAMDGDALRFMTLRQQRARLEGSLGKLQRRLSASSRSGMLRRKSTIRMRTSSIVAPPGDDDECLFYIDYVLQEIYVCRHQAISKDRLDECMNLEAASAAAADFTSAHTPAKHAADTAGASPLPMPVFALVASSLKHQSFAPPLPFRKVATFEQTRTMGRTQTAEKGGVITIRWLARETPENKEDLEGDDSLSISNRRQSESIESRGYDLSQCESQVPKEDDEDVPNVSLRMAEMTAKIIAYTTTEKPLKVRSAARGFQIRIAPNPASEEGKMRFSIHVGPTLITTTDSIGCEDVIVVPSVHRRSAGPVNPFARLLIVQSEMLFKSGFVRVNITDNYHPEEDVLKVCDIGPARPFQLKRGSLYTVKDAYCGVWEVVEEEGGVRGFLLRFDGGSHFSAAMVQQLLRSVTYENTVPSVSESWRALTVEVCDGGPYQISTFSTAVIVEGDDDTFDMIPPLPQNETIVLVLPLEPKSSPATPTDDEEPAGKTDNPAATPVPHPPPAAKATPDAPSVAVMPNARLPEKDHEKVLSAPAYLEIEAAAGDVLFLRTFDDTARSGHSLEVTPGGEVVVDDAGYVGYLHGGTHHQKAVTPQREEVSPAQTGLTPARPPAALMGGAARNAVSRKLPKVHDPSTSLPPHCFRLFFDDSPYSCIETILRNVMLTVKRCENKPLYGRRLVTISIIGCRQNALIRFSVGVEVTGPPISIGDQHVSPRGELMSTAIVRYAPKSMVLTWRSQAGSQEGSLNTDSPRHGAKTPPERHGAPPCTPVVITKNSGIGKKGNDLFLNHERFGVVLHHGMDGNGRFEVEFLKNATASAVQRLLRGLVIAPSATFVPLTCALSFDINPWTRVHETFLVNSQMKEKKHAPEKTPGRALEVPSPQHHPAESPA